MDDLLKEAIADAKAVRETALENAKIALEEAFTPRLQSMLSKKIQSEIDVEEGEDMDDEEDKEEGYHEDDMDPTDDEPADEGMHGDEDDEDKEEGAHEGVIEIDGVKYAPVVSEEDDEDEEDKEEGMHEDEVVEGEDEDDDMDEELDLEAVLRELEEDTVDEVEEPVEEGAHEDDEDEKKDEAVEVVDEDVEEVDEDVEEVDEEVDATTGIGSSDNKKGTADKSSGIGTPGKAKHTESVEDSKDVVVEGDEDEVEEEIDLDEIIAALSEEEKDDEKKDEVAELKSELDEHRNVVKYLKSKLNEVNLLNAKLLFTNKLFRSFGLTNDQKMKVVENFDRAHNLREVKLVYSTLAESFGSKQTKTEIKESKGSASKPVASTKSEKQEVISEGHELRDRFKKLAGIL